MADPTDNKSEVRAWIYRLLARLEMCADVEGELQDNPGSKVSLELQFKY